MMEFGPDYFLRVRDCSICGADIGFRADPVYAAIYFDTRCGCGSYHRELTIGDTAKWDAISAAAPPGDANA